MPAALFAVGAAVGKETVEPRYLIYGLPFLAMFFARGWREQRMVPQSVCALLAVAFVSAQLVGAFAMLFAHMTEQAAPLSRRSACCGRKARSCCCRRRPTPRA